MCEKTSIVIALLFFLSGCVGTSFKVESTIPGVAPVIAGAMQKIDNLAVCPRGTEPVKEVSAQQRKSSGAAGRKEIFESTLECRQL